MKRLRKCITDAFFVVRQIISANLTFFSTFVRTRASIGFELVAVKSQLAICKHRIYEKKEPRPRFNVAFRFLWTVLSKLWAGWRLSACLMQPDTVVRWHRSMFRFWWRWKSQRKGGRSPISRERQMLIRRLSKENACDVKMAVM